MKKETLNLFFLLGTIFIVSCNQEDQLEINDLQQKEKYKIESSIKSISEKIEENTSTNDIKFSYKGDVYTSKCIYTDSTMQIKNDSIKNIFDQLCAIPNIAICVYPDSSIEFYDSIEEMYQDNILKKNLITTRTTNTAKLYIKNFEIRLWRDAKGRKRGGPYTGFYSKDTHGNRSPETLYVPENVLIARNMDNAISSAQMWGEVETNSSIITTGLDYGQYQHASVTFFDGGNYTGESLTFDDISVTKTYSERDYFSSFGFNDKTSSFKVIYY